MQRVVVMGPPGSGKSRLARQIGAKYNLPVFHLDQAYWRAGWIEAPPEDFQAEVARLASLFDWVIDGNYTATIAPRFQAADTVIYLDVPAWLCLLRIAGRTLLNYGRVRSNSATGCAERVDWGFLRFAWNWNRVRRRRTLDLIERFGGRAIVLRPWSAQLRRLRQNGGPDAVAS